MRTRLKPLAAPTVGGMVNSVIHVLILVPVFFALLPMRMNGQLLSERQTYETESG
jgi:Cu/Ag efflux pump CusA